MKNKMTLIVESAIVLIRILFQRFKFTTLVFTILLTFTFLSGCNSKDSKKDTIIEEVVTTEVHLAFAGGGWRAHTGHAAWTMALLDNGNKTLDDVFTNVGTISSNSGGSWFSTMLMYSDDFINAIEAPNAINNWSSTGWLGIQKNIFDIGDCNLLHGADYVACVFTENLGIKASLRWKDIVEGIAYKGYPIDKGITLSGPRQPWAKDKPLLLAATMLTNEVVITTSDLFEMRFYQACFNPSEPILKHLKDGYCSVTPSPDVTQVTFSSIPSGSNYKAPNFLLQSSSSGQSIFNIGYKQNADFEIDTTAHVTIQNPLDYNQVPVIIAAATSSAAAGYLASKNVTGSWNKSYLSKDESLSFQLKNSTIQFVDASKMSLQELADNKVVRLADGGASDNSAVAQLVNSLQQNDKANGFNIVAFDNVIKAYKPEGGYGADVGTDIATLFGKGLTDGDKFCFDKVCILVPELQIFDIASLTGTQATWSTTAAKNGQVQTLIYTKYTVTTLDNSAFGITAGTVGTLHAFTCVSPKAQTVPFNEPNYPDFIIYNDMVQFINNGLLKDGGTGLKHLQNALNISQ